VLGVAEVRVLLQRDQGERRLLDDPRVAQALSTNSSGDMNLGW